MKTVCVIDNLQHLLHKLKKQVSITITPETLRPLQYSVLSFGILTTSETWMSVKIVARLFEKKNRKEA